MDNAAILYQQYLDGDNDALEELVKMYKDSLIFYINGFMNNISVSEDIVADTFVELIVKKNRFKNDYMFKTWLFKIARNHAIDYLRKQSKRQTRPIEYLENELSDKETLENTIIKDEQSTQLHDAMETMHNEYRDVLHLIYFEDMSYENAAAVLGKNIKQITNLVYRAKQTLKSTLEKGGFIYENI
jgi:RNA polymerase sigma-70 factor (ECF subfamily)